MEQLKININFDDETLDELQKSIFKKIKKSSYYKDLIEEGFNDRDIFNNVMKFKDYIEDKKICKKIKTYKDCIEFNKNERIILRKIDGKVVRDYCALEPFLNHIKYEKHFIYKDVGIDYESASLKSVSKNTKLFITKQVKNNKWLYFTGAIRTGRTYTAAALINDYIKHNDDAVVAFLDSPTRVKELTDLYFKNRSDFNELINEYSTADFVVFDNFGDEYKNEIVRNNIVFPIIKNRITNNLMTVFTSDYSIKEIIALYMLNQKDDPVAINFEKVFRNKVINELNLGDISIY